MIQNTLTKFSLERIIKNALYEDLGQNGDIQVIELLMLDLMISFI